jgi:hypothetical protein
MNDKQREKIMDIVRGLMSIDMLLFDSMLDDFEEEIIAGDLDIAVENLSQMTSDLCKLRDELKGKKDV